MYARRPAVFRASDSGAAATGAAGGGERRTVVIAVPLQPQESDRMSRNMAANIRLLTVREYLEPASRPVQERRSATPRKRNGTT